MKRRHRERLTRVTVIVTGLLIVTAVVATSFPIVR
jgi:hypothetical protein